MKKKIVVYEKENNKESLIKAMLDYLDDKVLGSKKYNQKVLSKFYDKILEK